MLLPVLVTTPRTLRSTSSTPQLLTPVTAARVASVTAHESPSPFNRLRMAATVEVSDGYVWNKTRDLKVWVGWSHLYKVTIVLWDYILLTLNLELRLAKLCSHSSIIETMRMSCICANNIISLYILFIQKNNLRESLMSAKKASLDCPRNSSSMSIKRSPKVHLPPCRDATPRWMEA